MSNGHQTPPPPQGGKVKAAVDKLNAMNQSAAAKSSPAQKGVIPCAKKKSWFAISVIHELEKDGTVVEGLTLKLKIPDLGETDRVTSKGNDPIKIDLLAPGGKGEIKQIESGEIVWEAVGDITSAPAAH